MDAAEKAMFEAIIAGFDLNYEISKELDAMPDNPMTRTAFYSACLKVTRYGRPLSSRVVQDALVEYYDTMRTEEMKKIPEWLTKGGLGS